MEKLPGEFLSEMKNMLKEEYPEFLASYEKAPFRALRLNPLKADPEKILSVLPFALSPAPFCKESYYLAPGVPGVGSHPLHHAGAYYVQEPSAAAPVTVLNPGPGDRVLDLCSAPGGKSTQIAAALRGKGILWSNEVVKNRAQVLLSNIERLGVINSVVSSCRPEILCRKLEGWFDKVLVDAPCSGEGMFRRDPDSIREWSPAHRDACAERQSAILDAASQAVKTGGILVYSTCTFSGKENEETVERFLQKHPEYRLLDCGVPFGRRGRLPETRLVLPMDGGEGQFMAKFQKTDGAEIDETGKVQQSVSSNQNKLLNKELKETIDYLLNNIFKEIPEGQAAVFGNHLVLLPEGLPSLEGLGVLRAGVPIGEQKKNRVEPAHGLFMAFRPERFRQVLQLSGEDSRIQAFLHGEEISAPEFQGYAGIAVEGVMAGFGKCTDGRLKNRYPKGLRTLQR